MQWFGKYQILRHIDTGGMADVYPMVPIHFRLRTTHHPEMLEGPDSNDTTARAARRSLEWRVLGWILMGMFTLAMLVGAWLWRQRTISSEEPGGPPATLAIATIPPGAQVWLDGKLQRGETPLRLQVSSEREHVIRLRTSKRPDWTSNVRLDPGEVKELNIRL